jgi:hypothetical protein
VFALVGFVFALVGFVFALVRFLFALGDLVLAFVQPLLTLVCPASDAAGRRVISAMRRPFRTVHISRMHFAPIATRSRRGAG